MMDRTDRHFRRLMRELSEHALLYTEMITTAALQHGDRERLLGFDARERPLALQLGGDDPAALSECAAVAEAWGYDEVDLNVGCPSERVQRGRFGACLMREPEVVADAVRAMRAATSLPVTVKHRLGVDELDDDEHLWRFVSALDAAGVDGVVVHARKALLSGLSPKQNRTVPPLQYERVFALKRRFPHLRIELNGGVGDLVTVRELLEHVDGVMVGRVAFEHPWALADADRVVFDGSSPVRTREGVVRAYLSYVEQMRERGVPLAAMSRHLLPLFNRRPGAAAFRRTLSECAHLPGAGPEVIEAALERVPMTIRREPAGTVEDPVAGATAGRASSHRRRGASGASAR
jgi:tRNA-dihydrouridine synthase A